MELQHSPAPFMEVDFHKPPRRCIVSRYEKKDQKIVATIDYDTTGCRGQRRDTSMFCEHGQAWANARLFRVAPAMLEQLKQVAALIRLHKSGGFSISFEDKLPEIECVIAEATGAT